MNFKDLDQLEIQKTTEMRQFGLMHPHWRRIFPMKLLFKGKKEGERETHVGNRTFVNIGSSDWPIRPTKFWNNK